MKKEKVMGGRAGGSECERSVYIIEYYLTIMSKIMSFAGT
jgi:hypothetical protein